MSRNKALYNLVEIPQIIALAETKLCANCDKPHIILMLELCDWLGTVR